MTLGITLLFKSISRPTEKLLKNYLNELKSEGLREWSHTNGTNSWTLKFESRHQYESAKVRIVKIPGIMFFYAKPDHLKEVSDALKDLEYFKAFTLCSSLYESYGKSILIAKFKKHRLKPDRLERLGIQSVIIMLYTHGLIKEDMYLDMIGVNETRNDFIHRYMSTGESEKVVNKIIQNYPKIMTSLKRLKRVNHRLIKR